MLKLYNVCQSLPADPLTAHVEIHYAVTEYAKYFMYENKKELVPSPRQK